MARKKSPQAGIWTRVIWAPLKQQNNVNHHFRGAETIERSWSNSFGLSAAPKVWGSFDRRRHRIGHDQQLRKHYFRLLQWLRWCRRHRRYRHQRRRRRCRHRRRVSRLFPTRWLFQWWWRPLKDFLPFPTKARKKRLFGSIKEYNLSMLWWVKYSKFEDRLKQCFWVFTLQKHCKIIFQ